MRPACVAVQHHTLEFRLGRALFPLMALTGNLGVAPAAGLFPA